jgi:hypothetical protein
LPPVLPGQFGWYASLAVGRDNIAVASWDAIYGDLVVARFARGGQKIATEYVDGYPLDGPVVANPDGPRGGRDGIGPNVGEHASIAVDLNNIMHVAYYDRTEGRLKYANDSGGLWKSSVVDEDGHVGMYTSIAIGPDGNPLISYMMVEGTVSPDPMPRTGLKYAVARTSLPMGAADWSVQVLDSRLTEPPICGGGCAMGQACIDQGAGPACVAEVGGCTEMCGSNEACVDMAGTPSCEEKVPLLPIDDLIEGTGLFTSLAFTSDGRAMIAYYDRVDGDLRLAQSDAAGTFTLSTVDGNDMMAPADVGQHASLAIGPGDIAGVAYVDATNDDLVYRELSMTGVREVVDNGVTPPNLRLVGPDASLIYDINGQPAIAYQDPTNLDLLYARKDMGGWSTEVLKGAPPPGQDKGTASGFYASQKREDTKAFISNVDVTFDPEGNLVLDLGVMIKDLF